MIDGYKMTEVDLIKFKNFKFSCWILDNGHSKTNEEKFGLNFTYIPYEDFIKKTPAQIVKGLYIPLDDHKLENRTKAYIFSVYARNSYTNTRKYYYKYQMNRYYYSDNFYKELDSYICQVNADTKYLGMTGRTETIKDQDGNMRVCDVMADAKVPHLMWRDSEGRARVQE